VPKDGLEESEKNRYIGVRPVTGGQESVSQHSKGEFLDHLEGGWWSQGRCCVGKHRRDLNCGETLGVESIYIATPPPLVAVDIPPIVGRLSLSRKLHLAFGYECGSRHTINLSESACASQDALRPAVLEERSNIDCGHHGPFSSFRFFCTEMLKKVGEGGGEVVKLDIGEEHPMRK
jgi:hypothetical protein